MRVMVEQVWSGHDNSTTWRCTGIYLTRQPTHQDTIDALIALGHTDSNIKFGRPTGNLEWLANSVEWVECKPLVNEPEQTVNEKKLIRKFIDIDNIPRTATHYLDGLKIFYRKVDDVWQSYGDGGWNESLLIKRGNIVPSELIEIWE
jgi:hypothetical protein